MLTSETSDNRKKKKLVRQMSSIENPRNMWNRNVRDQGQLHGCGARFYFKGDGRTGWRMDKASSRSALALLRKNKDGYTAQSSVLIKHP